MDRKSITLAVTAATLGLSWFLLQSHLNSNPETTTTQTNPAAAQADARFSAQSVRSSASEVSELASATADMPVCDLGPLPVEDEDDAVPATTADPESNAPGETPKAYTQTFEAADGSLITVNTRNPASLQTVSSARAVNGVTQVVQAETQPWTILVYMAAAGVDEATMLDDFMEIANADRLASVNVAVQLDRGAGNDNRFGDWTGTERFLVDAGSEPTLSNAVSDWGDGTGGREVNMGDAASLADFIAWGTSQLPSENTILIVSGSAIPAESSATVLPGVASDAESDFDNLTPAEIAEAVSGVDIVLFDADGAANLDLAAKLAETDASAMVGSEAVSNQGLPYVSIIHAMADCNDALPAARMLTKMVSAVTGSAASIELAEVANVKTAVDELAESLLAGIDATAEANAVCAAVDNAVVLSNSQQAAGLNGIGIAFPTTAEALGDYLVMDLASEAWTELLSDYPVSVQQARTDAVETASPSCVDLYDLCMQIAPYTPMMLRASADEYENDDEPANATLIENGDSQRHTCHTADDDDWLRFEITERSVVLINTDNNGGIGVAEDTMLQLYDGDNLTSYIEENDDGGTGFQSIIARELDPGTYYIKMFPFAHADAIEWYNVSITMNPPGSLIWVGTGDHYESVDAGLEDARQIIADDKPLVEAHSLHNMDDLDYFRFQLARRGSFTFHTINPIKEWRDDLAFDANDVAIMTITVYDWQMEPVFAITNRSEDETSFTFANQSYMIGKYFVSIRPVGDPAILYTMRMKTQRSLTDEEVAALESEVEGDMSAGHSFTGSDGCALAVGTAGSLPGLLCLVLAISAFLRFRFAGIRN